MAGTVLVWQLKFGSQNAWGYLLNGVHLSRSFAAAAVVEYGLRVVGVAVLLWGMMYFTQRRLTVADTLKTWFIVVAMGVAACFAALIMNLQFWHKTWYDAVFILTRNAMPMVSGVLVFSLAQPGLVKIAKDRRFAALLIALMSIGIVFPTDVLKFGGGFTFTGAFVIGCVALVSHERPQWLTWRAWLAGLGGLLSIVFMTWVQASRQLPLQQALRYVTALSPLTVLPAARLVQQFNASRLQAQITKHQRSLGQGWVLAASLIATGVIYWHILDSFGAWCKANLHVGPFWVLPEAVVLVAFSGLLIAATTVWLRHLALWRRIDAYWQVDLWQALQLWIKSPRAIVLRIWHEYWHAIVAFATLYVIQAISILLMSESLQMTQLITHKTDSIFSTILLSYNFKILGGALLLGAAYWIVQGVTGRYWLSLLSVASLSLVFAVASRLKILSRATPIVPSDTAELGSFKEILTLVNPVIIGGIVVLLIAIVIAIIWLERHTSHRHPRVLTRIAKVVCGLCLLVGLGSMGGHYSFVKNVLESFGMYIDGNPNMLLYAQTNGPIVTFVSQLDVKVMDKPSGYSKNAVERIVKRYQQRATTINANRSVNAKDLTVLFNLSESFAEPTRVPGVTLNKVATPYIDSLKKQTVSGLMLSAGYGGGTANMEYESLTGMSMGLLATGSVIPNNQIVPGEKTAINVGDWFSYASAIHPYTGGYYNRIAVYRKYGFNKFSYLGSQYPIIDQKKLGTSMYLSDETAYANALKQIRSRNGGQFVNLITMQNHMPYTANVYPKHDFTVTGSMSSSEKSQIAHYTQGLAYTDQAVKQFKMQLDKLQKPVIWVFYGDHLPGIYDINASVTKYATDYFIYANKFARKQGMSAPVKHAKYVSTNDFIAMALQTSRAKVNAYTALLTDVQQKLPTLWQALEASDIGNGKGLHFVTQAGKVIDQQALSKSQQSLLRDYQMIQYDLVAGKQYSLAAHMTTTVKK